MAFLILEIYRYNLRRYIIHFLTKGIRTQLSILQEEYFFVQIFLGILFFFWTIFSNQKISLNQYWNPINSGAWSLWSNGRNYLHFSSSKLKDIWETSICNCNMKGKLAYLDSCPNKSTQCRFFCDPVQITNIPMWMDQRQISSEWDNGECLFD